MAESIMAESIILEVNGTSRELLINAETPLLYILRNELELKGPRFGCGLAQCGSCSVLVDGREIRSCITPVSAVANKKITTLEGLPQRYSEQTGKQQSYNPVQQAMIDEQATQCGYCANGMIIKATELLEQNPSPNQEEIIQAMNGHLCRCGTYQEIIAAIGKAARIMEDER